MTYDHHEKAGNRGDVVKHVALLAALDTFLQHFQRDSFEYADTFAGYAYSPLIKGNEWKDGIGTVFGKGGELKENPHTKLWYEWYLQGRPQLIGGVYPGSSLIANDVCRLHKKQPSLALWDVSPEVIANLMQTYSPSGHRIYCRPATLASRAVQSSDFLFIDPPGLKTGRNRKYPSWESLRPFLKCREGQIVLMWLPVKAVTRRNGVPIQPPEEDQASITAGNEAVKCGCQTLHARWADGGRTIGCLLITNATKCMWAAVEAAVKHVVKVANWQSQLSTGLWAIRVNCKQP